jgi:MOSC domain-containing protein YiiM
VKLESINVAQPREVTYRGRTYATSIFKQRISGRVAVRRLNIDGDAQGNLKTHGGPDMAVYVFGHEDYAHWAEGLGRAALDFGAFGENLTVTGMREDVVCVGDIFRIGSARLQVTEPRTPCHKLAMKFDDEDLPRRFAARGNVGFYFRVLEEGEIGAGDDIQSESRDPARLSIADVLTLWADKSAGAEALGRALAVSALSATWRARFEKRLVAVKAASSGTAVKAASAEPGQALKWSPERLTWI